MTQLPQDDDLLAAEFVLGVLPMADRMAVEHRMTTDATFVRLVDVWEARLLPLTDAVDPVAPAPALLAQIEQRLFPAPVKPQSRWFAGLWAIGGGAMAAGLVALFLLTAAPVATLTAQLAANESAVSYLAQVSADTVTLTLTGPAPSDQQAHELWLIVGDGAPVSLGVIGADPLALPQALEPGMILAVSLEPAGGSPTGAPTGPVLALGALEKI